MKLAPNWVKSGDHVDAIWKQDLLRFLGKEFNLKILVETGTCAGSTLFALKDDFDVMYSIEASKYYFDIATKRLSGVNANLWLGDSSKLLGEILSQIRKARILFWLDAHDSGGLTANIGDPLPAEIAAIQNHAPCSVIVIDDYLDTNLQNVTDAGYSLDGWERYYVSGEIVLFRTGMYKLPAFEE